MTTNTPTTKKPKLFLKLPFGQYGLISTLFNKKVVHSVTPKEVGHDELCPCCAWKQNREGTDRVGRRMWSLIAEDYKAYKLYRIVLKALQKVSTLVSSDLEAQRFFLIIKKQLEAISSDNKFIYHNSSDLERPTETLVRNYENSLEIMKSIKRSIK